MQKQSQNSSTKPPHKIFMKKDSRIFVAGHRGLVGSAIVSELQNQGFNNLILKTRSELDLLDSRAVESFFAECKIEFVFLAAAKVGGILANNTYRADFILQNLNIQNNVIFNAYKFGIKKLLFLGSSCIYPKNCPQPIKEESLLTSELEYTNEPYAIAKIAGIKLCESFNLQYGTNFLSIMPTNLYGKNDNFSLQNSHVLPALIRKFHLAKLLSLGKESEAYNDLMRDCAKSEDEAREILSECMVSAKSVAVWGSGNPRREFLHSTDLARACVYIMQNVDFWDMVALCSKSCGEMALGCKKIENLESGDLKTDSQNEESKYLESMALDSTFLAQNLSKSEIKNMHINVGYGEDISIKDLAFLVKEIVGFDGEIIFDSTKPDGTFQKLMDSSKMRLLGFAPRISLKEGIAGVYEDYKSVFGTSF